MSKNNPIGRVVATERNPTTTVDVRFWLESDVQLKPFDIVRLAPSQRKEEIGEFYAIINEIQQVSDVPSPLSSFISADFGNADIEPRISRVTTTYADATVLFNTRDIEMPVPHESEIHWPDEEGVRRALGIEDYNRKTPAGYITMSGPGQSPLTIHVDMDADYLMGPEGGHLNISGISGLATKTSYAMFLLTSIQQKQETEWKEGNRAAFIILNVKGADLLSLHEEAHDLDDGTRDDWAKCGLTASPLKNVTYFYPCSNFDAAAQTKLNQNSVERNIEERRAYRYFYNVSGVLERLRLLVEDIDDPNQTLVSCADYCTDKISHDSPWASFRHKIRSWAKDTPDKQIPVVSWRRFARLIGQRTKNPLFTERGRNSKANRQVELKEILNHLAPGNVVVIDIAQLPDYIQSFVVGDVIDLVRSAKVGDASFEDEDDVEEVTPDLGTVILFADELNKFAPKRGQTRSITRHLREISERGRSEGIILFGAEQFRTGVDEQVTGNSSTQVFGRTTSVEAGKDPEIKGLPGRRAQRVPFLRKGELLVSHTRFSAGTLKLRFPRNAYKPG